MQTTTHAAQAALQDVVARYWGYTAFRPLQREAMEAVIDGRDSIVVLPTGGGKSLCFQAPALVRPGLALVVSPLISLMKDQVDTLVGNGVPAALYNSSLASDEKAAVISGLRQGDFGCSTSRPSGSSARAATDSSRCWPRATSASSPSTRRTASASGGTTSGPSTVSSAGCGSGCRASACTPTRRRRRRACAATSRRSWGCENPAEFVGSFDRPNLLYRVLAARAR